MSRWVLTPNQDLTWRVLRQNAGRQAISRLSLRDIQDRTGFTRAAVLRHLDVLERLHRVLTLDPGGGRGRRACRIVPRHFSYAAWRKRGYVRAGGRLERVSSGPAPLLSSSTEERPHQRARAVPGSGSPRMGGRQASHPAGKPLGVVERDLATREGVDGLYGRLGRAGWLEPCDRFRELVHGLVSRARRVAQNRLAFVAGVVRRGLWQVVGERDRESARAEIAALDSAVDEIRLADTPTVDLSDLMSLTAQIAQGWTRPMTNDPKQVGNLYSQRMGQPRPAPTKVESELADEHARQVAQGRYVYGMAVHDGMTLGAISAALGVPDQATVRELGAMYAKSAACETQWGRAMSRLQDRDVGASPTSRFGQMREAQRQARLSQREAPRGGEPKSIRDLMGPVFGER